jgi:serpin B
MNNTFQFFKIKREYLLIILILSTFFSLVVFLVKGCKPKEPDNNPTEGGTTISPKQRLSGKPLEVARVPDLIKGNTAFAFNLYHQLIDLDENLVFSPHSLSLALGMTYAGARSETEAQMAQALHFNLHQSELHPAFNSLDQNLAERESVELHLVNVVWGSSSTNYLDAFLDTLAENYGAGIRVLDFSYPEESRKEINQWMSNHTEDRIHEILPPGAIHGETELILTNAIFFKAPWENPFPENGTQGAEFTLVNGDVILVDMMTQTSQFRYVNISEAEVIEIPYEGDELSMLVILPDIGNFELFARDMDAKILEQITSGLQPSVVQLSLPNFQFEYKEQIKEHFINLGMVDAFGDADFSNIDGSHELFIDQVYHQAFIDVGESGTEAAAGSAVVMSRKGIPESDITLSIDRPFIFLIQDNQSDAVLFLGHVLDPSQG